MPSPTTGTTSAQSINATASMWLDVDADPRIVDWRRNREFLDIIKGMGGVINMAKENKKEYIYWGYYGNALNNPVNTTGATITGNGTSATPFSVTALGADAQYLVVKGDILALPSGKNVIVASVPTAASFTARTVDGSSTTWTAGQYATNISAAYESGSNAPTARRWGVTQLYNVLQIIRTNAQETDVAATSVLRTMVNGQMYVTPYQNIQLATLQYAKIMGAIMQGQLGGTLFTDASPALAGDNGRGIQTTMGLEQYITTYGVNDTVSSTGTVGLADVADFISLLVANRSPKDYMICTSTKIGILYSNMLKNLPSSGGVNSVRLNVDGTVLNFDTEVFNYGGFNMQLKSLGYMDNVEMVGSSDTSLTTLAKKAIWIPIDGGSPSVGAPRSSYINLATIAPAITGGTNRSMEQDSLVTHLQYGGLAPTATDGNLVLNDSLTSYVGLRLNNPQAFGAQTVLA